VLWLVLLRDQQIRIRLRLILYDIKKIYNNLIQCSTNDEHYNKTQKLQQRVTETKYSFLFVHACFLSSTHANTRRSAATSNRTSTLWLGVFDLSTLLWPIHPHRSRLSFCLLFTHSTSCPVNPIMILIQKDPISTDLVLSVLAI